MTSTFRAFLFVVLTLIGIGSVFGFVTNQGGAYTISFDSQSAVVVNTNIETDFEVRVTNNLDTTQTIGLDHKNVSGWNIITNKDSVELNPGESEEVIFTMSANSNFDYSENVVSSDTIKIGKNEDYRGYFEFPVSITSNQDNVSIVFQVQVVAEEDLETSYEAKFSSNKLSPQSPLSFTVEALDIGSKHNVTITPILGNNQFEKISASFSNTNAYQIFSVPLNSTISPGNYEAKVVVREESKDGSAREWSSTQNVEVVPYSNIEVEESSHEGILIDSTRLLLTNRGNVDDTFIQSLNHSSFQNLFFTTTASFNETQSGVVLQTDVEKGERKAISYAYNYVGLYIIVLVLIFIVGYLYIRKTSNPFDVETKVYDVERTKHEGIKSLKIRIGFENLKIDKIESLKVVFRMPVYLRVQEESFLVTPPNHVYKGKTQYKLEWNFKNFEKNDSRILGFAMVNSKGILGDIRFGDLEFEVKVKGKVRKYYTSLPVVKG